MRAQRDRLRPRSYTEVERHILLHAKALAGRPLDKIDRRAVAELLSEIATNSGPTAANRVRSTLSAMWSWSIREGLAEVNPVTHTGVRDEASRERVLTADELRDVWAALRDDFGAIVKLLMLTGQRRVEIGALRWSEVDLEAARIVLPSERTKNNRQHVIPLSRAAISILEAQPRRVGADGVDRDCIFGETHRGFQGWNTAKKLTDRRILEARKLVSASGRAQTLEWCLHDLRRTMSTIMHDELGIAPHIVESILNHVGASKRGVAGVYNRAKYTDEKASALARWGDHVLALVEGRESNVVALRGPRA